MQSDLQALLELEAENKQIKNSTKAAALQAGAILRRAAEGRTDAEELEEQFIAELAEITKLSHKAGYNECMQAIAVMGASTPGPIQ